MPFTPEGRPSVCRRPAARRLLRALVLTVLLCALASPVSAQTTTLSGIVHDPNGRVAEGVPLVAERVGAETDPSHRWETVSTEIGYYEFPKLPPGQYRITIELPPFRPVTAEVLVQAGHRAVLDIALRLGSDERVTVEGRITNRPLSAVDLGGIATVVQFSRNELDTLPLANGRTVQSLQVLVPGLLFTDSVGTLAQFTAIGQRRFANRMTIDGVSADLGIDIRGNGVKDAGAGTLPAFATSGGTQTLVAMEAIEGIEVRTSNVPSEHARTPGAQTAIVTRAGGDRFSGTGYFANRPEGLTASDWFANAGRAPRRGLEFWNGGATVGGPALTQRLFFFASWEGQRANRPMPMTVPVPSEASRAAAAAVGRNWLRGFPLPNGKELYGDDGQLNGAAEFTHTYPMRSDFSTASLRLDAPLGMRHRLFARFNQGDSHGDAVPPGPVYPFEHFTSREKANVFTLTGGLTSTLSTTLSNDLRVNISRNRGELVASPLPFGDGGPLPMAELVPADRLGDSSVFLTAFTGAFIVSGRTGASAYRQVEIADTLAYVKGRHQMRAGLTYNRMSVTTDTAAHHYVYRFNTLSELLTGRVRFVRQEATGAQADRHTLAAFAQDTIRLTPRLTVDAGVRYRVQPAPTSGGAAEPLLIDFEALPNEVRTRPTGARLWDTARGNVSPHLGLTYQASTATGRETTLRAGWDRVFDDLAAPGVTALTQSYPIVARRAAFLPFPLSQDLLTGPITPFAPDNISDYATLPRSLRTPRTTTWQVGVEQALGDMQRVSAAYVGARGRDLLFPWVHQTRVARIVGTTNDARSDYHGLLTEYVRRWSDRWQARAVYTWSHAIDTHSGEKGDGFHPPPWLLSPELSRGSADFDRRHALQISASYRVGAAPAGAGTWRTLAADWQVDVTGIFRSGAPIDLRTSGYFGGTNYTTRPDVVPGQPYWLTDPTSPGGRRLNVAAFGPQLPEELRDRPGTLGRNALYATWLRQVDLALSRSVRLRDRLSVQARLEAFNVFNIPNFGAFNDVFPSPGFGEPYQSYADSMGVGTLTGGGLMPIQQVGGPRSLQLSVRVGF